MTRPHNRSFVWLAGLFFAGAAALTAGIDEGDEKSVGKDAVPSAKRSIEKIAPELPAEVVSDLQFKHYPRAAGRLEKLERAAKEDDRGFYAWTRGIALRLDGKSTEARSILKKAIEAHPRGPWAAKLRGELATVELALGRPDQAEVLARAEVEALLDDSRKDRLATVYQGFAERLLAVDPLGLQSPDPEGAYALLAQAYELAKSPTRRAELRFAMIRAGQSAGNHPRAIQDCQAYLSDFPKGNDRAAVRLALGKSQLAAGQTVQARLTWTDLARDLKSSDTKDLQAIRARALYAIPQTFGMPKPPNPSQLSLGVAATKRALAEYPADPQAVRAAFEIGSAFANAGRLAEAISAYKDFLKADAYKVETEAARRDRAESTMTAVFEIAGLLQAQEKYREAIEAYRDYLARFPNGPHSAEAQRLILDNRLALAEEWLRREKYETARKAWSEFAKENPLDPRVPEALYLIGSSFLLEKKADEAEKAWEALATKFPDSEPAARAEFEVASLLENDKGDLEGAIERYRKIKVDPWKTQARVRIAVLKAKSLVVVTPRTFRSAETPKLKVATRNIEKLTFTAYKLDLEAYFRKKQTLSGVESLDIGLVAADAEWTIDVPKYAKYKPIETEYSLKVAVPGAYVVKVTDERTFQATTLVLGGDLDAIVKASRLQLLVYAQDMKTGKARANARVLVADGSGKIVEAKTGKDGVLLMDWDKPRDPSALSYLILDGPNAAGSGLNVPGAVSRGLSPRAYLYTDRPAYRPGQDVQIRGIVREVRNGRYAIEADKPYSLTIADAKGRIFLEREVKLNEFGTFHETLPLDSSAPVGAYRIVVKRPGSGEFAGTFDVQAYQLEKADLTFKLPQTIYRRGEKIKGSLIAVLQGGIPLARKAIRLQLPDGRALEGETDAEGRYEFELATEGFGEDVPLGFTAILPAENVSANAVVMLASQGFRINLSTVRPVYLDGETFPVHVRTIDAKGDPIGEDIEVVAIKTDASRSRTVEREVARKKVRTDAKTGKADVDFAIEDKDGGSYVIRASGVDSFQTAVFADWNLSISGSKDPLKLRLISERLGFNVGEEARVDLVNRSGDGPALLTFEADKILSYRLIDVKEGRNPIAWTVGGAEFPNFTLNVARMADKKLHEARLDLGIVRALNVSINPKRETVGPNEEVEVAIETTDQLGKPISAEVGVALVDSALLRLHPDALPPIGSFFYDQYRIGAFSTSSTIGFEYRPPSIPVPDAIVEQSELELAEKADEAKRDETLKNLKQMDSPAAAPLNAPARMGGMGGAAFAPEAPAEAKEMDRFYRRSQPGTPSFDGGGSGGGMGGLARKNGERDLKPDFFLGDLGLGNELGKSKKAGDRHWASPRSRYIETAYWNPSVVTGKDGKATIRFKAPSALSRYEFKARGTTGASTLVGQSTGELKVTRDFFVDLKTPETLIEGDRPRFVARVHHRGVTGKARLRLSIYAGGRETVSPRNIELKEDGVDEVSFEPFEVPGGETKARLSLTAKAGKESDSVETEVSVRPWGVQAIAFRSGLSSDDATVFVELPGGRDYQVPTMTVSIAPGVRRLIVEAALSDDPIFYKTATSKEDKLGDLAALPPIRPIPVRTVADVASDLLAATSALGYLKTTGGAADEARRLAERARSFVGELVSARNDDGGWPWVSGNGPGNRPSDPATSARVVWSLATAERLGLLVDRDSLDKGIAWLTSALGSNAADSETRAAILHALSERGVNVFEQANGLNRSRRDLNDAALAELALAFSNLDRRALANEALDVLAARVKTEALAPGEKSRKYWDDPSVSPWQRSAVETTALAVLAFDRARPDSELLAGATDWLIARRSGNSWMPRKAKGPAVAALAAYHGFAERTDDRYRLTLSVNKEKIGTIDVDGATEGRTFEVPRRAIKLGAPNRVRFDLEGRGSFGYSVALTGFTRDFRPEQNREGKPFHIERRVYQPANPELNGKPLPVGFQSAIHPKTFENVATQVAFGGRVRVVVDLRRDVPADRPNREREFLIVKESLPAGTSLAAGSLKTNAGRHDVGDGVLTFYFSPDTWPGEIQYDLLGYLPGRYRALPTEISSAYEPDRRVLGPVGELTVLSPGEESTDPYRPTPDELFARGKTWFEEGKLDLAGPPLERLAKSYTLQPGVLRETARMLLAVHIKLDQPRSIVDDFETLKTAAPDLVLPFDQIRRIGRAYATIGEHERAYLVWRAVIEAGYLEDARLGELLRQRGKDLESLALLLSLWREYPDTASIRVDFFGLSQYPAVLASRAKTDAKVRRELTEAGVSRPELLAQSIKLARLFLAVAPNDPIADEAGLALLGSYLELEDYPAVVRQAPRFAESHPKSKYADSFLFAEALGRFHLGEYDRAVEVAKKIAESTYKDENGVEQPGPNKWEAIYILGQIYDARQQPAQALSYYEKVADRFSDAAGAVKALKREKLVVPEVVVIHPARVADVAEENRHREGGGDDADRDDESPRKPASIRLDYRNIALADVKVYPVDLMRLYLTRRNLDAIAGIDLAGVSPLLETKIRLGDGEDYAEKTRTIDLPLKNEGAYLVMVRGDDKYVSGVVLVSPLELEVLEETDAGRVRVLVRDARSKAPVRNALVKAIGSNNAAFVSGRTDLRGVFVAEGIRGLATVVARQGTNRYAFHRGKVVVGDVSGAKLGSERSADAKTPAGGAGEALDKNLKSLNYSNQLRQLEQLQRRYGPAPAAENGVQIRQAR